MLMELPRSAAQASALAAGAALAGEWRPFSNDPATDAPRLERYFTTLTGWAAIDLRTAGRRDDARALFRAARGAWPRAARWTHEMQVPASRKPDLLARPFWGSYGPGASKQPFSNDPRLAWLSRFAAQHYEAVLTEVVEHLAARPEAWTLEGDRSIVASGSPRGGWEEILLYQTGEFKAPCRSHFRATCRAIAERPEVAGVNPATRRHVQGQATIFRLAPGAHIVPHCGGSNERLTAHLGLIVPRGARIRVGNAVRTWEEGRFLVFDDSFEHEVWHAGDEDRIVLYMSIFHPEQDPPPVRTKRFKTPLDPRTF
jgi:hypothetical protein